MVFLFLKQWWVGPNSLSSMYEGVLQTVDHGKAVVAIPMKVLVCVDKFPIHCCENFLSGLGVTSMSKKGIDLCVLGSPVVNCM